MNIDKSPLVWASIRSTEPSAPKPTVCCTDYLWVIHWSKYGQNYCTSKYSFLGLDQAHSLTWDSGGGSSNPIVEWFALWIHSFKRGPIIKYFSTVSAGQLGFHVYRLPRDACKTCILQLKNKTKQNCNKLNSAVSGGFVRTPEPAPSVRALFSWQQNINLLIFIQSGI